MADYCFKCGSILTTSCEQALNVADDGDTVVTFYYRCPRCKSLIPVDRAFNLFEVAKEMY